jgi:hypothetical protein
MEQWNATCRIVVALRASNGEIKGYGRFWGTKRGVFASLVALGLAARSVSIECEWSCDESDVCDGGRIWSHFVAFGRFWSHALTAGSRIGSGKVIKFPGVARVLSHLVCPNARVSVALRERWNMEHALGMFHSVPLHICARIKIWSPRSGAGGIWLSKSAAGWPEGRDRVVPPSIWG